ncbi:MAG: hypothetical protein ACOX56_02050 [Acholeplasmataceae bacterium]
MIKKRMIIILVITLVGLIVGAVMMITGINQEKEVVTIIGIALLILSFAFGFGSVVYLKLNATNYCPICGKRKVAMSITFDGITHHKYECPKCFKGERI